MRSMSFITKHERNGMCDCPELMYVSIYPMSYARSPPSAVSNIHGHGEWCWWDEVFGETIHMAGDGKRIKCPNKFQTQLEGVLRRTK